MEDKYFIGVRSQTDGSHRIHKAGCPFNPPHGKRLFLGKFDSPERAQTEGKEYFDNSSRCPFCSAIKDEERNISDVKKHMETDRFISSEMIIPTPESGLICALS